MPLSSNSMRVPLLVVSVTTEIRVAPARREFWTSSTKIAVNLFEKNLSTLLRIFELTAARITEADVIWCSFHFRLLPGGNTAS